MKTKLVFVLTCTPEANYIEQATIAIFSARYHNPSAYIVLLVDDKTDLLFTDRRGDILQFISEKIVIPFEEDKSMLFRSRSIKTSVRRLVDGDFMFIDCDTVTTRCLDDVDSFTCKMGAVLDSHLPVRLYGQQLMDASKAKVLPLGIDLEKEEFYFSSGVLFVKDAPESYALYDDWHSIWIQGVQKGVNIDQPSLAKANINAGHLIQRIDDRFNCVIYTQPDFAKDASILHFTAYRNPSWLFSKRVLNIIEKNGIGEWLIPYILDPVSTYIPFRYSISKMSVGDLFKRIKTLSKAAKVYASNVDASFSDMNSTSRWYRIASWLFKNKHFTFGSISCLFPAWIGIKIKPANAPVPNICAR